MRKSKFSEEQIIGILREAEGETPIKAVCARHNISEPAFYKWRRKFGGMDVSEARQLRALEEENALETVDCRLRGADPNLERGELKKVVGPSSKRRAIQAVIEQGVGTTAEACRAVGLARSSYYRNPTMSRESRNWQRQILHLSQEHPRYGYSAGDGVVAPTRTRDQRQTSATSEKERRVASQPPATKAAATGSIDGAAATGHAGQPRLELGLCGGPDGERDALSSIDVA